MPKNLASWVWLHIKRDQHVSASIIHAENKDRLPSRHTVQTISEGCWQDQIPALLTLNEPSGLTWTSRRGLGRWRPQQLIKPALMALTLAHNPREQSWREKGQSLYNITEWGVRCLADLHCCIDYKTDGILLTKTFPSFSPWKCA